MDFEVYLKGMGYIGTYNYTSEAALRRDFDYPDADLVVRPVE